MKFNDGTSTLNVATYGDGEPSLRTFANEETEARISWRRAVVLNRKQTKQLIKLLRDDRRAARERSKQHDH